MRKGKGGKPPSPPGFNMPFIAGKRFREGGQPPAPLVASILFISFSEVIFEIYLNTVDIEDSCLSSILTHNFENLHLYSNFSEANLSF